MRIKPKRLRKISSNRIKVKKAEPIKLKGVSIMKAQNDKYSSYGELGEVLRMTNQAVQKSGLTKEELLEIEKEARRSYGKSRGRY